MTFTATHDDDDDDDDNDDNDDIDDNDDDDDNAGTVSTKAELEDFLELDSQTDSGVATKALLLDYARSREALNTTIQLANGMFN